MFYYYYQGKKINGKLQKMEITAFKEILTGRKSIKGRKDYESTFTLNGV